MSDQCIGPQALYWAEKDQQASEPDFYGKWIDAKDLPKSGKDVLLECRASGNENYTYQCIGYYLERWDLELCNFEDGDAAEYNEKKDQYYQLEGWYECQFNWDEYAGIMISDDVVRYMILPDKIGS